MNTPHIYGTQTESTHLLRSKIEDIDAISQSGLSRVCAIARLASIALESPGGDKHIGDVTTALSAIRAIAMDVHDCINAEAETVGCNHKSPNPSHS